MNMEADAPEPTWSWLKATNPTERGGNTDTPPYVSAYAKDGAPSSDESALSTRWTSRGLLGIMRIKSLPIDGVTAVVTADDARKDQHR